MAQNIDKTTNLTSDVYGINAYINRIKKEFTPGVEDQTLLMGTFGYLGQVFSDLFQNDIVMASEFSNESIPTKAKFEKNIIAHALSLGVKDINAVPAQFEVLLTFIEDDIESWAKSVKRTKGDSSWDGSWNFTFDKNIPIYIGDYEFHTDYDIYIRKVKLTTAGSDNKFAYTAKYIIGEHPEYKDDAEYYNYPNPISEVENPYLSSPVRMKVNGRYVIFVKCTLRQVEKSVIYKKILADNSISSKTLNFEFEGQLAAFDIDVIEGNAAHHLNPVYEGLIAEDNSEYGHFYYSYLDSNVLRIKFDRDSYQPRINSEIRINIQTTQGDDGNFTFSEGIYPSMNFESDKYGYSSIGGEIRPLDGSSLYGTDRKSIEELRKYIPKEALSRGSITNTTDLENYFNMVNSDSSMMYFYKKRDNALERLYYSFLVMKDDDNNVIPMNTIDVKIKKSELKIEEGSSKYVLNKGQMLRLSDGYGTVYNGDTATTDDKTDFMYIVPYTFIVNTSPLYGMYQLSTIDTKKYLDFTYINEDCLYQYVSTNISWIRGYLNSPNTYELTISTEQNIDTDINSDAKAFDENGMPINDVRCIAVFYDADGNPLRWADAGKHIYFDSNTNIFTFRFFFTTEDFIDDENNIRINETGLHEIGSNVENYAHMPANTKCVLHFLSKQGENYGLNNLDSIVPDLDGYSLSNSYTIQSGLDFFYDYSEIVNSVVTVEKNADGDEVYVIRGVPVVKYDYFSTEDRAIKLATELVRRKSYIDESAEVLEDAFSVNFKFFNTYGPSRLTATDAALTTNLDRVNISLQFKLKLSSNYDTNITNDIMADIKAYIEDLSEIKSIHIPNLEAEINSKYKESIDYFEFAGVNGDLSIKHLYAIEMPDDIIVPEFINVHTLNGGKPDIVLSLV